MTDNKSLNNQTGFVNQCFFVSSTCFDNMASQSPNSGPNYHAETVIPRVDPVALHAAYDNLRALIAETTAWSSEDYVGGAISTVVHTAYHLGEIRQALCTLKP